MGKDEAGGAGGGGIVVPARPKRVRKATAKRKPKRPVGFSKPRARLFLETLEQVCNVAEALRVSGLAETTVRRRRKADAEFRVQWDEAIREGYARLEAEMLDRAVNGVEKAVWHGGQQVGTVRQYSDAVALALLRLHADKAGRAPSAATPEPDDRAGEAMVAWLGEINRRMGGEG